MKISFSSYALAAKRQGALLKVEFEEGMIGYADCHPWPELGDVPLQEQLHLLARAEKTALTACALEWALLDATARKVKKPLLNQTSNNLSFGFCCFDIQEDFEHIFAFGAEGNIGTSILPRRKGKKMPKELEYHANKLKIQVNSHYLIPDIHTVTHGQIETIQQMGFTHLKIKMKLGNGRPLLQLFSDSALKLRLDFNESLRADTFREFLEQIEPLKEQIDFIEDPFPFHPDKWSAFQQEGWRLACDREMLQGKLYPDAADILILKPAIQPFDIWPMPCRQTIIVTSYLGHPLEQVVAAFTAATVDPRGQFVHGLLSHSAYQPNAFSRHLNWEGPQFTFPKGDGFGFDQELAEISWSLLV